MSLSTNEDAKVRQPSTKEREGGWDRQLIAGSGKRAAPQPAGRDCESQLTRAAGPETHTYTVVAKTVVS